MYCEFIMDKNLFKFHPLLHLCPNILVKRLHGAKGTGSKNKKLRHPELNFLRHAGSQHSSFVLNLNSIVFLSHFFPCFFVVVVVVPVTLPYNTPASQHTTLANDSQSHSWRWSIQMNDRQVTLGDIFRPPHFCDGVLKVLHSQLTKPFTTASPANATYYELSAECLFTNAKPT